MRSAVNGPQTSLSDMREWWGEEYPSVSPPKQKRPRPRAQNLPPVLKPRGAMRRVQRRRTQTLSRALMYMTFVVLAVCLFMQVNRYALIASQTKQISSLVTEIRRLESDRTNLELRLSARENLKRLRSEAIYNLGMDYPTEGQVRVVALRTPGAETLAQTAAISADSAQ